MGTGVTPQTALARRVAVVGVGATRQGEHPDRSGYQLGVEALEAALADAGMAKSQLDGLLGAKQFDGSGVDPVELSRLVGLNPRVTGFLDYGTGGFTTQYAAMLIATGICDVVACVYARNPRGAMTGLSGAITYDRVHGLFNAAGAAALGWTRHMALHGTTEEALGRVAVAARKHARLNPIAAFTDPLTLDDYLAQDYLLWPFRELDICKLTAGGVALVLTSAERARDCPERPVYFLAAGRQQAARTLENDEHFMCAGMQGVAQQVYGASGLSPSDVDVLFVSDASTAAVLQTLENYGFCDQGACGEYVKDGRIEIGGTLPVNPNGGQLSEGYLVGWLHHVEMVRQLRGECGARQVEGAEVAQYCTTGRFREDYLSSIYVRG